MDEKINLTAFSRAVATLHIALDEYQKDESNEFVRDSCIQRFEYCFDSAKKIIKRYLKKIADDPMAFDNIGLENLIRDAYTKGLVKHSWDIWDGYRQSRNTSSHGYNEEVAISIVEQLPAFYIELVFLLENLKTQDETSI